MSAEVGEIITGLKELLSIKKRANRRVAGRLTLIANLLGEIVESFEAGKIPRRQAYAMAALVNFVNDDLIGVILVPSVRPIFKERIPEIGRLMRQADLLVDDWNRRGAFTASGDSDVSPLHHRELYEEIERTKGLLEGAAGALSAGLPEVP